MVALCQDPELPVFTEYKEYIIISSPPSKLKKNPVKTKTRIQPVTMREKTPPKMKGKL